MDQRYSSRLMIINEEGHLLLFLYDDGNQLPFWATVGGELKGEESFREAALRELYEETGIRTEIGEVIRERKEVYAVARSEPALWHEKYFLVRCDSDVSVVAEDWTDEEKVTIQKWRWWSLSEMKDDDEAVFKPEWLSDLLERIVAESSAQRRNKKIGT